MSKIYYFCQSLKPEETKQNKEKLLPEDKLHYLITNSWWNGKELIGAEVKRVMFRNVKVGNPVSYLSYDSSTGFGTEIYKANKNGTRIIKNAFVSPDNIFAITDDEEEVEPLIHASNVFSLNYAIHSKKKTLDYIEDYKANYLKTHDLF